MLPAIANAQPPRIRIALELKGRISRGVYQVGQSLPTEMDLTEAFGASRPTVRAALALLEEEGLLKRGRGRSRVVTKAALAPRSALARTVAVMTESVKGIPAHQKQHGWWAYVLESVVESVRLERSHSLLLDPAALDDDFTGQLIADRPRGLIAVHPVVNDERVRGFVQRCRAAGLPVVLYGFEPALADFDTVCSDHETGAALLTRWLLARGRRGLLRVWPRHEGDTYELNWVSRRLAGFDRAMREAGLEPWPVFEYQSSRREPSTTEDYDFAAHALAGYLAQAFRQYPGLDTLIVPSDGIVYPVATACRILGREPGRELMIVGYDNYWRDLTARRWECYVPPVTVDKHNDEIGRALARMLFAREAGKLPREPQLERIAPELVTISEGGNIP